MRKDLGVPLKRPGLNDTYMEIVRQLGNKNPDGMQMPLYALFVLGHVIGWKIREKFIEIKFHE